MCTRRLVLVLALTLAACASDRPTLIAGDSVDDASDAANAVADDSAPRDVGPLNDMGGPSTTWQTGNEEVGPTTTAPWDWMLTEYPLLAHLERRPDDTIGLGSASFILVDETGEPRPSGSDDFPTFLVKIDGWFGVNDYVAHTIMYTNVALSTDGQNRFQCGNTWAGLKRIEPTQYLRTPNVLPKVLNTGLDWGDVGCDADLPIDFAALFDGFVEIEVTDDGFVLNNLDALQEPAMFLKIPSPWPTGETSDTPPPQSTTTTTELTSD